MLHECQSTIKHRHAKILARAIQNIFSDQWSEYVLLGFMDFFNSYSFSLFMELAFMSHLLKCSPVFHSIAALPIQSVVIEAYLEHMLHFQAQYIHIAPVVQGSQAVAS